MKFEKCRHAKIVTAPSIANRIFKEKIINKLFPQFAIDNTVPIFVQFLDRLNEMPLQLKSAF